MADNDPIIQSLGFDAGDALSELSSLNESLDTLSTKLAEVTESIVAFNAVGSEAQSFVALASGINTATTALDKFSASQAKVNTAPAAGTSGILGLTQATQQASQSAQQQLAQLNNATQNAAGGVASGTGRMTISFGLLSRIAFTQTIIRGLRDIEQEVEETGNKLIQFQQTANLASIADSFGRSASQLQDEAREVSNAFNIPLGDVLTAQLTLVRSGISDTTTEFQIFTNAAGLSKATGLDFSAAVKLLASTMTDFGKDAGDANQVAGILFQTLAHSPADVQQTADTLGRLSQRFAELHLPLTEEAAALDVLGQEGLKSKEAVSELTSILSQLVKPSEELKSTMSNLGLDQARIQSIGLAGTLTELINSVHGSNEELAKLFPNARSFAGIGGLTLDDLGRFTKAIDGIGDSSGTAQQKFNAAVTQISNESIEQLQNRFNQIGNSIVSVVGAIPLGLKQGFVDIVNGIGKVEDAASAASTAVSKLLGSGSDADLSSFNTADHQSNLLINSDLQQQLQLQSQLAAAQKLFATQLLDDSASAQRAYNDSIKSGLDSHKAAIAIEKADISDLQSAYKSLGDGATHALASIATVTDENNKAIERSQDQIAALNLAQKTEQIKLDPFNTPAQANAQIQLLDEQTARTKVLQATQLLGAAGLNQQERQRATVLEQESAQLDQQAIQVALQSKNVDTINAAYQAALTNQVLWKQALQQSNADLQSQRDHIAVLADQWSTFGEQGQAALSLVLKNIDLVNAKGELIPVGAQQAAIQEVTKGLQQLQQLGANVNAQNLQTLGFDPKQIQNFLGKLQNLPTRIKLQFDTDTTQVKAAANQALQVFENTLSASSGSNVGILEKLFGGPNGFQAPSDVTSALANAEKQLNQVTLAANAASNAQAALKLRTQDLVPAFQAFGAAGQTDVATMLKNLDLSEAADRFGDGVQKLQGDLHLVDGLFDQLSDPSKVTADDLKVASGALDTLQTDAHAAGAGAVAGLNPLVESGRTIIAQLQQIVSLEKQVGQLPQLQLQQQQLGKAVGLGQTEISRLPGLNNLDTDAQAAARSSQSFASQAQVASDALGTFINAVQDAGNQLSELLVGGDGSQFGHVGFFNSGGVQGRGVDTIPAMLSPGESVLNARTTSKFFSQIQALNAGHTPVFPPTSNTTLAGDVNINMTGQPVSHATAREVMTAIRRELRRKTGRIE